MYNISIFVFKHYNSLSGLLFVIKMACATQQQIERQPSPNDRENNKQNLYNIDYYAFVRVFLVGICGRVSQTQTTALFFNT